METTTTLERFSASPTCEVWKDIKGYEGIYQISNCGRVKSLEHVFTQKHYSGIAATHKTAERIMKLKIMPNGYLTVDLSRNGKHKRYSVHRLVAFHFIEKPKGMNYINHLDANKTNNRVDNLEWCTQSHNIQYAYDTGRKTPPHMKKVAQYDMDGNLLKIWESTAQAGKILKIQQVNISKVCRGERNKAGGYKWKYLQ